MARKRTEDDVTFSPYIAWLIVTMTICYLTDGNAGVWFLVGIVLGTLTTIAWWVFVTLIPEPEDD